MFEFAVKRPVAVTVIMLALVSLGIHFGMHLKLELIPTLDVPVVSIVTTYPGAGPSEVEEQVSKKIEDQVGTVEHLKKITSRSQDNVSIVIAEFHYGTDMIQALSDVRDKVEIAKRNIPKEADNPTIYKIDPNSRPIVTLAMYGTMDLRSLRDLADDRIKKELEKVAGVASVRVSGGYEREILVEVDPGKLDKLQIAPSRVVTAIQQENVNVPAGNIITKNQQIQVRTVGQVIHPEELKDIYIDKSGGRRIFLRDIAKIKDTNKEQTSITRVNGEPCVTIEIMRNNDANIDEVCDSVKEAVVVINKTLPKGTIIEVTKEDADMINKSVNATFETAIEAVVLAVFVIFMFLATFRSTIVVSLSIPISVISTFIVLNFGNYSINLITLSAITLAIGRVIDDSIVVLENIFRFLENGYEPMQAAIEATKEVGLAVLASTLTTMSVFLPLLLLKGIVGQYFIPLAMTFMTALLVSLVVAVLLIPMLSARVLRAEMIHEEKKGIKIITVWFNNGFKVVEKWYGGVLHWSVANRYIVILIGLGAFITSLVIFSKLPLALQEIGKKEFAEANRYITATAGTSQGSSGNPEAVGGSVVFRFKDKKDRTLNVLDMRETIQDKLKEIPGLIFTTNIDMGGRQKSDVEIILKGNDLDELARLGEEYKEKFAKNVAGASELDLGWKKGKPEYRIVVDRQKAGQYGINLYTIGSIAMTYIQGTQVADVNKYKENERDYDITVQLGRTNRNTKEKIENIPIRINDDLTVPLSNLAKVEVNEAPSKITRDSRQRSLSITGSAAAGYQNNQVVMGMAEYLQKDPLPDGYTWSIGGEEEDRGDAFGDLFTSLALAIFIVYVILAIQFESFIHPFTIMMAVPLELVGVSIALLVTGEPVSMVVMLGIILLTGIVVSNSILLINYIIVLREQGIERNEAVLKAGPIRLRPILMTATATIIAMIPLALGSREGAEFFAPLGKIVIGGLLSSTFLTLLVVPCVYIILDDIGNLFKKKDKGNKPENVQPANA